MPVSADGETLCCSSCTHLKFVQKTKMSEFVQTAVTIIKKQTKTKQLTARPTSRFNTQAPRDGQQVAALHERLQEKQRLLPGVQLLRLLQPVPPGGGLVDPVGTDRQ